MATTTTLDFDHGSGNSVTYATTIGNRFTVSKAVQATAIRAVLASAGFLNVGIWRVSDMALLVTASTDGSSGYNQLAITPTTLSPGVEYVVGLQAPAGQIESRTPGTHTHGVITWLNGQRSILSEFKYPETTGADFEALDGLVLTYNDPPTSPGTPSVTPNPVNTTGTISWPAASDPDGDALTYDVELSTNNGASFSTIASNVGGTSTTYNFAAAPSSTTSQVRVRAKDTSGAFGPYATSALFTIQHNVAPTAPTDLVPSGGTVERSQGQRLSWTFTDPDPGDTQSKRSVRYRVGSGSFTTVTATTTATYWDAPANTFPLGSVEWQVQTFDSLGVASPWSASAFFASADTPDLPVITSPSNNAVLASSSGVLAWSSPSQEAYQVQTASDAAGTIVYTDSGEILSATARDRALTFATNNRSETIRLRIRNNGLWSGWATVTVTVSFTPPSPTEALLDADSDRAAIVVTPVHGPALEGQPPVVGMDIYRRDALVGGEGTRIAKDLPPSVTFIDYTPAFRTDYEYSIEVRGSNDTTVRGPWNGFALAHYETSLYDLSLYA